MRAIIVFALSALSALGAAGQTVPRIVWRIDAEEPRHVSRELRYGETIDWEVGLQNYGAPLDISGAVVTLHARTNGMPPGTSFQIAGEARAGGTAYVRIPVSAWLPYAYRHGEYTLSVAQPDAARILRVSGPLTVMPTSAAAAADPVPVAWADGVAAAAAAAAVAAVDAAYGPRVGALESQTNGVAAAAGSDALRLVDRAADPSRWIDANGYVWQVSTMTNWIVETDDQQVPWDEEWPSYFADGSRMEDGHLCPVTDWFPIAPGLTPYGPGYVASYPPWAYYIHESEDSVMFQSIWRSSYAYWSASYTGSLADAPNVVQPPGNTPEYGSPDFRRVVSIVTQHVDTVVTQQIIVNASTWMVVSNETLTVFHRSADGLTNILWSSLQSAQPPPGGIDPEATNALWGAISALQQQVAAMPGAAWGDFAPDGSLNPAPDQMVFINRPTVMFAAGYRWQAYGTHAVIQSYGTAAFEAGGDGQYRIGPDSENWFGYVAGGTLIIGAVAQGISTDAAGTPEGTAQIIYPFSGGDYPVIWFAPALSVAWEEIPGVTWSDNGNGTATVTAPATSPSGFWRATTSSTVANMFSSTMPAVFSGGVFGSTNSAPVIYNSTITIQSGGSTYRLPAQLSE
jgi:hypothetical protein